MLHAKSNETPTHGRSKPNIYCRGRVPYYERAHERNQRRSQINSEETTRPNYQNETEGNKRLADGG